jgi:hypothetical protein
MVQMHLPSFFLGREDGLSCLPTILLVSELAGATTESLSLTAAVLQLRPIFLDYEPVAANR